MTSIVSAKSLSNLTPFKSGKDWTGNRLGRPKNVLDRDRFTGEIMFDNQEDIKIIVQELFSQAKQGNLGAIKLVIEYALTRAKPKETEQEIANNNELVERLKVMPSAKLIAIHNMIKGEMVDEQ